MGWLLLRKEPEEEAKTDAISIEDVEIVTKAETEESTGKDLETMADAKLRKVQPVKRSRQKPGYRKKSRKWFRENREEDAKKAGGTVRRTEADGTSDSWCALLLGTER